MTAPDPLADVLDAVSDRYSAGYYQGEHEPTYAEVLARAAREHIAAEIEAERDSEPAVTREDMAYNTGMTDAAKVARGEPV